MENRYKIELFFELFLDYIKNSSIIFLGPQLPFKLSNSTLVSSPIGQNVVMIGGFINEQKGLQESPYLLELSGDSYETLDWKILDKKLKYPRQDHISFCISNDIATTLKTKSIIHSSGHAPQFLYQDS